MFGCATTANVSPNATLPTDRYKFVILGDKEHDPINVADVICSEIQKEGYNAEIITSQKTVSDSRPTLSIGSGFFISEDGILLTSAHVLSDSEEMVVRTTDSTEMKAKVLVQDLNNDVAVLKIIKPIKTDYWLSIKKFKNTDLGDHITIIGFPLTDLLGDRPRVTEGIISADAGIMNNPTRFQISASIQPGNSGGPILTDDYQVVGIATEKLSDSLAIKETGSIPQNVNFGVKIDYTLLLFDREIERSVNAKESTVKSIGDAIKATALIRTDQNEVTEKKENLETENTILVTFKYQYIWDVFQYTLPNLTIYFKNLETGEIIATGDHVGSSLYSYVGVTRQTLQKIFQKVEH